MKIKQKMKKKTRIILASTLALALVVCATVAYIYRPQQNNTDANNPVVKESTDKKEDSKKVDDNSTKPEKRDGYSPDKSINTGDQQSSESKKSVVPIVSGYGLSADKQYLQIDGGVNSIVENGGSCEFTLYWAGGSISRKSSSFAGPSSTSCHMIEVSLSELPSGSDISVKVSYSSKLYTGESSNNPSFRKESLR
ncbi:hypothetical protein [Candidatus Nanosynbacter sp. TM7-053]|uniref:hypothetical protein n=1 Tax=Candidatus Nanosynbacter sp. TM7-053 TaxID=2902634 RepID=UPI001FB76826|nr:hypothetical protein [Candidatus Nanosynbacter sp. TM7-053]MCJ1965682.1 hypothetical protein [Candidatus Nanosynbacter sp. TM7-053]